jgi:hypothetical protein
MEKKKKFLTIRIDEEVRGELDKIYDEFNKMLPCGVSQTYVVKTLLAMGMETFEKQEGFIRLRSA